MINYHLSYNETFPYWFVLHLTLEMLYILSYLHKCKILHADIKVDNILVNTLPDSAEFFNSTNTKCLVLIDFNRSIDLSLFPREAEFLAKTARKELMCSEMQADRPWSYQVDYYGIISSIFSVIFRKYMQTRKVNGQNRLANASLPRQYDKVFARMFNAFLNITSSRELPDLDADFIKSIKALFANELDVSFRKSDKYLVDLNKYYLDFLKT